MATKQWFESLAVIKPYIFRISTPYGRGTGFQIRTSTNLFGIATAYHVVEAADEWGEPIKIVHHASDKTLLLKEAERVVFPHPKEDLAFILIPRSLVSTADMKVPATDPTLLDFTRTLKQGAEIGWCGFPSVASPDELCFFAGHISADISKEKSYLVDGVIINGVSGGPAFYADSKGEVKICGVISAYRPNRRNSGETLPGLGEIQSVKPYKRELDMIGSMEEARQKAEEQQAEIKKGEDPKPTTAA